MSELEVNIRNTSQQKGKAITLTWCLIGEGKKEEMIFKLCVSFDFGPENEMYISSLLLLLNLAELRIHCKIDVNIPDWCKFKDWYDELM